MWNKAPTVLLISLAGLAPQADAAGRPELNAFEQQQLPQYCWGQHVGAPYAGKPQYHIPRICGNSMNHICPGHIYLIAAQRPLASSRDRRFHARKAIDEFGYTQRHMAPKCPLKAEVDASMAFARFLEKRR